MAGLVALLVMAAPARAAITWSTVFADDFDRPDGAPGSNWWAGSNTKKKNNKEKKTRQGIVFIKRKDKRSLSYARAGMFWGALVVRPWPHRSAGLALRDFAGWLMA